MSRRKEQRNEGGESKIGEETLPNNGEVPITPTVKSPKEIEQCTKEFLAGDDPIYTAIPNYGIWCVGRLSRFENIANTHTQYFAPENRQRVTYAYYSERVFLAYGIISKSDLMELGIRIYSPQGEEVDIESMLMCKEVTSQ